MCVYQRVLNSHEPPQLLSLASAARPSVPSWSILIVSMHRRLCSYARLWVVFIFSYHNSPVQICPTQSCPQLRQRPTQYFLRLSQLSIFPTLHSHNLSRISHIPIEPPLIYAQLSTFSTQPLLNSVLSQLSLHPTGSFLFFVYTIVPNIR
jgi:hypothetical protein